MYCYDPTKEYFCFPAEEIFPQDVKPNVAVNSKVVTCLTSPIVSLPVTLTYDKGRRRHTLACYPQKTSKRSLRDELLRTIAAKEMRSRSSQMLADVRRTSLSLENVKKMNESKHVRRSSLVHDVIHTDHEATRERRMSATNRKMSLITDVTYRTPEKKPKPATLKVLVSGKSKKTILIVPEIDGKAEREKELRALKFSEGGTAARLAAKETHLKHEREKATSKTQLVSQDDKTTTIEKWRLKCLRLMNKKQ